jgi:hypothetical protein
MLKPYAKHQSNPQQRRQRRKELIALDLREHSRRKAGVLAKLGETELLLQAERSNFLADFVPLQPGDEGL